MDNNRINYEDINVEKELEIELIREALELYTKGLSKNIKTLNGINKKNINPLEAEEISIRGFFKERQLEKIENAFKNGIVSIDDCETEQLQHVYFALCELKKNFDDQLHSDFPTKEGVEALAELYERQVVKAKKSLCNRLLVKIEQIQKCNIK